MPNAKAGTCTTISRTNNSANSVLTSSGLNTDFNQLVTQHNAYDGGCITDGTLEDGALNTTDFNVLLSGMSEGCKVTRSDSNTISIDICRASINGNFLKTTSAVTATWGCTGCSSESGTQDYYIFIKDGSSGSTLTPLILTGAPNADGYDGSNNKVLAKITNNGSLDILDDVLQWKKNEVDKLSSFVSNPRRIESCFIVNTGTPTATSSACTPWIASIGDTSTGISVPVFTVGTFSAVPECWTQIEDTTGSAITQITAQTQSDVTVNTADSTPSAADIDYNLFCYGER